MVLQRLPYKQNLLIDRGSRRTFGFIIAEGLAITASAAAAGASTLTVLPLQRSLSAGDRLIFGDNTGSESLVVASAVSRGATSIPLSNTVTFALSVAEGNLTGYKITNLTGYAIAAQIRADWDSATPLATFTTNIDSEEYGEISIAISATDAALLEPNIDEKEAFKLTDEALQDRRRTTGKRSGLPDDYVWDLDITPSGGEPSKTIEGLVLVSGQVTQ